MIAILDTGVANTASVFYAVKRLGYTPLLTADLDLLQKSTHLILPGVGTASALMERLNSLELIEMISSLTQPVLGICLGMQALYEFSEEGNTSCIKIFPGKVTQLRPTPLSVPHMGWNKVHQKKESLLLKGVTPSSYFYFVHSYQAPQCPEVTADTEYGERIPAVIEQGNWFGTQFHPERSGQTGEKVLQNFLTL